MPGPDKPNIILINADDLGYGDLSCYGATKVATPHINRLAAEGRRFTDAHAASAVCSPSRYGLLTGEYPIRRNFWGPTSTDQPLAVDPHRTTLASLLRDAGYATAMIGKWHLGFGQTAPDWNGALKPGPLELGFDYFFGVPIVNSIPPYVYVENHHVVGLDPDDPFVRASNRSPRSGRPRAAMRRSAGRGRAHELYRDEMVGTTLAKKTVDWIRSADPHRPYFCYLATTNIHHPLHPRPAVSGVQRLRALRRFHSRTGLDRRAGGRGGRTNGANRQDAHPLHQRQRRDAQRRRAGRLAGRPSAQRRSARLQVRGMGRRPPHFR
jgi:arylsulfatase A